MISILYFVRWYPGQNSNYNSPWFFSFLRWIKSFSFFSLTLFSSEGRASRGKILKGDREFLRLCKNIQLLSNSNTLVWEFHTDKNNSLYSLRLRTGRYSSSGGRGGGDHMVFRGNRGLSVVTNRVYGNTKIDCQWGGIIRILRSLRGDLVTKILSPPPPL